MTFKVEDKRLFSPDGQPLNPVTPPPAPEAAAPVAERPAAPAPGFGDLVLLLGAQAGMCMGGMPVEPGAPAPPKDLEAARHFIDLLEVLELKSRGNLDPEEEGLLREVLTGLRMQFVHAVGRP